MNLDHAVEWVRKQPGAVSGSNGHSDTFKVACRLVNGFALSRADALAAMRIYNLACSPPWSEREIVHKVDQAERASHDLPRGHMLEKWNGRAPVQAVPDIQVTIGELPEIDPGKAEALPEPIADGTRAFLKACFEPGEYVSISPAILNAEGKSVPKHQGVTLKLEEWLKRLDEVGGDPNQVTGSIDDAGIFVRVNPMKSGGKHDSDVTAFRHALIEFDSVPIPEQWNVIRQSGIPCSVVTHSGGKSIHAIVKIDALNLEDYRKRVDSLFELFKKYKIDPKNRNPSRFSRLPGAIRGQKTQQLLSHKIGAENYDRWLTDLQVSAIGSEILVSDLVSFDPHNDPNNVIGNRWLCRGMSCLIVGQSGIGKSSLTMQAIVTWGLGRPLFGIRPVRPLKSLILQAENDRGDLAEQFQGVATGLGLDDGDRAALLNQMVIIRDSVRTGEEFVRALEKLIDKYKPDLVWIDPLLSYIGDDISSQKVCGQFLRNWLNPISEKTGVIWMVVHHTGKTPTDSKARAGWSDLDYSYFGTGSSELTNWAREAIVLKQDGENDYSLLLTKRGGRAGATHPDGTFTRKISLARSGRGICWNQVAPSDEQAQPSEEKGARQKETIVDKILKLKLGAFLDACTAEGESQNAITKRLEMFAAARNFDCGQSTCRPAIARLVERGALRKCPDGLYRKGNGVTPDTENEPDPF